MRLELGSFAIEGLEFGAQTALRGHTLVVSRDEIRDLILEDPHFADVEVDLARPGESVRILHVVDVVEPRWKVAGPGGVFPGFVSPPGAAGEGRTHRLAGVAVVDIGEPVPGEPIHWRERVVDMSGPGAQYTPFGQTLNVVLHFKPNLDFFPPGSAEAKDVLAGGVAAADYNRALNLAGMKVAARLARTSQDAQPDQVEVFELGPCDPGLPRVACIYQQNYITFLHGAPVALPMGTVMHPNECFDGALLGWRGSTLGAVMYWEQNNEVLMQLCRRHGKDLNFLGCIVFGDNTMTRAEKERVTSAAARLARLLGAQVAIFMGTVASNFTIDLMLAIQKCEQAGIKTSLLYYDFGYGPGDPGLVFSLPEADAIVCAGSHRQMVTIPGVQKLIGGDRLIDDPDADPRGELTVPMRYLHGAVGVQGYNRLTTRIE